MWQDGDLVRIVLVDSMDYMSLAIVQNCWTDANGVETVEVLVLDSELDPCYGDSHEAVFLSADLVSAE